MTRPTLQMFSSPTDERPARRSTAREEMTMTMARLDDDLERTSADGEAPRVHLAYAFNAAPPGSADIDVLVRTPDDVVHGDLVVVMMAGREWSIVSLRRADHADGEHNLDCVAPQIPWCGVSIAAVERRVGRVVGAPPGTLDPACARDVLDAIAEEVACPTPWPDDHPECSTVLVDAADRTSAAMWGCTSCGRDPETEVAPRFGVHLEQHDITTVRALLCPSCHDMVHQPLGPSVENLVYRHRPVCPQCHERRTHLIADASSPIELPIGVSMVSRVVDDGPADFLCTSCGHTW